MKEGWLLDTYVEGASAVLWVKLDDGNIVKLTDSYRPSFYVEARDLPPEHLAEILKEHPNITETRVETKFTRLDAKAPVQVLRVYVEKPGVFRRVLRQVEALKFVKEAYNVDLLHVQRYLFEAGVAPMTRIYVTSDDDERVTSLQPSKEELRPEPPPFAAAHINVEEANRIARIAVNDGAASEVFEGQEREVLSGFLNHIKASDPDLIVAWEEDLKRIFEAAKSYGFEPSLGRCQSFGGSFGGSFRGRVQINPRTFNRLGIAGIAERSRFTVAPPGLSAEWPAGKTIDSRQCYEAYRSGFLIPRAGFFQRATILYDLIDLDKGGLVLSPEVGLHEKAAVIDFESMFPHIIVRMNVSYETVQPRRLGPGIMVGFTEEALKRRMHFKHLRNRLPRLSQEWLWCEQRQLALKEILVCDYGYSGCFANRFGNVATYQEINRIARDIFVRSMNIAQSRGFRVLYGNNDSLFVSRPGAMRRDYEELAGEISRCVGLPMVLDHHFKFLVLLPKKGLTTLGAANRYYGKLMEGGLHCRGLELRRHDTPPLIKRFQRQLVEILLDYEDAEEVQTKGVERAWAYVLSFCDEVRAGQFEPEDFIVSKVLRKPLEAYRSMAPHVAAAWNLRQAGMRVEEGDLVDFIFVAEHRNPLRRVQPVYDGRMGRVNLEKYVDLVKASANSVLEVFMT